MKRWLVILGILAVLVTIALVLYGRLGGLAGPEPTAATPSPDQGTSVVARGLEVPWAIAFAPDGRLFVTERPGRVRVISNGKLEDRPVLTVEVPGGGEGGLQGLALDPDFANNHFAYLYVSYQEGGLKNKLVRYQEITLQAERGLPERREWLQDKVILDGIPGNNNHNGGRLAFGPDKKLYLTTGDSQEPSLAQDKGSLAGKILRLNPDGSTPADNPFGNLVWSYGHRNPQGIAWTKEGVLYEAEHGPSGDLGLCCRDEVNRIEKGGNYGWPAISGDQKRDGLLSPLVQSGSTGTWAPAGLAVSPDGVLYFSALRGQNLHKVVLNDGAPQDAELLTGQYGRLREAIVGPDGKLYVTTSNRDGRGTVREGDDQIIRLTPP